VRSSLTDKIKIEAGRNGSKVRQRSKDLGTRHLLRQELNGPGVDQKKLGGEKAPAHLTGKATQQSIGRASKWGGEKKGIQGTELQRRVPYAGEDSRDPDGNSGGNYRGENWSELGLRPAAKRSHSVMIILTVEAIADTRNTKGGERRKAREKQREGVSRACHPYCNTEKL